MKRTDFNADPIPFDENFILDSPVRLTDFYRRTMRTHQTTCRVIYGDTDNMGIAYHANYLRWFEMGRTEMFRSLGLSYKAIEAKGVFLPVSEVHCKFKSPAHYDDVIVIETTVDARVRAGIKFDYRIFKEDGKTLLVGGYTKHACMNGSGRVIRPPDFLTAIIGTPSEME